MKYITLDEIDKRIIEIDNLMKEADEEIKNNRYEDFEFTQEQHDYINSKDDDFIF